jgi:DMSO/TMAO reductase YedYZ molybdopterin-dependent catalytic subunit
MRQITKKSNLVVAITVVVLSIAAVALWFFNYGNIYNAGERSTIAFTDSGETFFEADLEYIKGFESASFESVIRSSVLKPAKVEYTGVMLLELLYDMDVDIDVKSRVIVKGSDGYMTSVSMSELESKDIYIAYEMDGKPLKPREKNGYGPFQLVIPGDPYSQRWCKYIYEVEVL